MLDVLLSKGSNGLLVNNKVLFIIETKKVPSGSKWLFSVAEKFGIDKSVSRIFYVDFKVDS